MRPPVLQRRRPQARCRSPSTSRERGVNVWNGDNYAWELAGVLEIRDSGGAVRAGVVHYNDESDVNRLARGGRRAGLSG